MPVDKFGRTNVGASQRVVSGGVTSSQVNNTFLRRDGENTATGDISLDSHKLINVLNPTNDQDAATKHYVDGRTLLPYKKFLTPYASGLNEYIWSDYQTIPPGLPESEFDDLPAGFYACYTGYLPPTRLGNLPAGIKGYLIAITYQQPADRNKYYKWTNSINGEEWEAYFKTGVWSSWVMSSKVSKAGDTMTGDLNMGGYKITNLFFPTASLDAVNKNYVDGVSAGLLRVDGSNSMTGALDMGFNKITTLQDPTSAQDAATKNYVDDRAYSFVDRFPPVDMSGLTAPAPFVVTTNNSAASGWYAFAHVDAQDWLCSGPAGAWVQITGNFRFVLKRLVVRGSFNGSSGTITSWTLLGSNDGGANFVQLADQSSPGGGSLTLTTTRTILLPSNTTAFSTYRFNCTGGSGTVSVNYIGLYNGISNFDAYGDNKMLGNINMDSRQIVNLLDPTGAQHAATKNYVDTKAGERVAKAGDTMTGNLSLSVGTDTLRTLGCSDLSGSKGFSVLLGNVQNQIQCQLNQPVAIQATDGVVFRQGSSNIIRFGRAVGDLRTDVFQDIVMNQKYIADLHDPTSAQDAATKIYVDNSTKKCYSGYVPVLEANVSRLGFIASASSTVNSSYNPYGAFNNFNADGANGSWVSSIATGWLQIQCPEPVKIWKVALKARFFAGRNITAWNIAGSTNGTTFTTLLTSTTTLSGSATTPSFFNISTTTAYQYYRFNITASVGAVDTGVHAMQLYVFTD